jgi:phage terminase large subunit-like protein
VSKPARDLELPAVGTLTRPGAKPDLRLLELPPWHGWAYRSEAARARRWVEAHLAIPTGYGAGQPFKLAGFQRRIVQEIYDNLATFVSLPAANGKTTLLAALALERICRGDPYSHVLVVATKQEQAELLIAAAVQMVERCPALVRPDSDGGPLVAFHSRQGELEYRPSGARLRALPAKLSSIQGESFALCIIDEVGFGRDEIVESMVARLGKRPDAHLVGIGTPGLGDANVLQRMRAAWLDDELPPGVHYLEHAAAAGCDLNDRAAWRDANPALGAGFLRLEAIELQMQMLSEREARSYILGQYVDTAHGWLPAGAWEACAHVEAPPDGSPVVLAVEGTYRRTLAVVGSTLTGEVFFGWAKESATDAELRAVIEAAAEQYEIVELVRPPRIRPTLFAALAELGLPVTAWNTSADNEAKSANEFYRAITEGQLVHDHDELIAQHVSHMRVRWAVDGSLRLARPDDGFVDAAFAARAAWWAAELAAVPEPDGPPVIY